MPLSKAAAERLGDVIGSLLGGDYEEPDDFRRAVREALPRLSGEGKLDVEAVLALAGRSAPSVSARRLLELFPETRADARGMYAVIRGQELLRHALDKRVADVVGPNWSLKRDSSYRDALWARLHTPRHLEMARDAFANFLDTVELDLATVAEMQMDAVLAHPRWHEAVSSVEEDYGIDLSLLRDWTELPQPGGQGRQVEEAEDGPEL